MIEEIRDEETKENICLQIVNVEEDFLLSEFGDEYEAYMKGVRRYIGRK